MSVLDYRCFSSLKDFAPHMVLIHGWGIHGGVWAAVIPHLRECFHLTVVNRAGYGSSPRLSLADELRAVLALAPPRAIYVGWSLGSMLALEIATHYPERVQAVVAIAANPCFLAQADWLNAMPQHEFLAFRQAVVDNPYLALTRFLGVQCQGSASQRHDMRFLQQHLAAQPLPHSRVLLRGLWQLSLDRRLYVRHLRCPQLWLHGSQDHVARVDVDELMALNPLRITLAGISDAAHVPFVSHPLQVARQLERFVREEIPW